MECVARVVSCLCSTGEEAWGRGRGDDLLRVPEGALVLTHGWLSTRDLLRTGSSLGRKIICLPEKCLSPFQKEILVSVYLHVPFRYNFLFLTLSITSALWPESIPPRRWKSAPINLCDCGLFFFFFFGWGALLFALSRMGMDGKTVCGKEFVVLEGRTLIDVCRNISL